MTTTQTRPARGDRSAAGGRGGSKGDSKGDPKQITLDLPMMTVQLRGPEMRMPHLEMPDMPHVELPHVSKQEMGQAVDVVRSFLPAPERVAYYGALGALAVFGVLDWPVAAAIGAGTMIAQRARKKNSPESEEKEREPQEKEHRTTTRTRRATATATTRGKRATAAKPASRQSSTSGRTRSSG
jgi:hypothetical protein